MTGKMLNSTRPGMTRGSSFSSLCGKDFLELVWENGQILVQGGSSNRTQNTPPYIGYSINPSRNEEGTGHGDASITERTKLGTVYSLLDKFSVHRDSELSSSHESSDQHSCQIDFQFSQGKNSSKLQGEFANLRSTVKDSKLSTREVHQPPSSGNAQLCTYSSQQCLPSVPLKKPRILDSSHAAPAATKSHTQYFGCDQRTGKVNFPNFLIPALFYKSAYQGNTANRPTTNASSARVEEIEVGKVEKTAVATTSSKGPDHSTVIESANNKGPHELKGFQEQTYSLTANKLNPASLVERTEVQPVDEHSEVVGHHNSALRIQGSRGQHYNGTSSSVAPSKAKGIAYNTDLCNEPLPESSHVSSLGASNDPNIGIRKNEDTTDDSTYLSDNDEETEDVVKETPAREVTRVKRSRNAEIHNLSERKRRDKINKKIRALKELIPNCNKMDKASTLDDAIDYLKTLKLQLQIMSMGSGLCMPLMMLPHVNAAPHFPHLMGAGMCFSPAGTGIPCSPPQFPIPPPSAITDNTLHMFGFSNQMRPPMPPISHAPFIPMTGNSSAPPLIPTSTGTNLVEHLANSATLEIPDLHAKAEYAAKHATNNQVSFHDSTSYPFYFPTRKEEKTDNGQEGKLE